MPLGANKAAIMGVAGVSGVESTIALLSTQTATSDTSLTFNSDIDSSYREYVFRFYNCNPETNNAEFQFGVNASGGSGYDETITSTLFETYHDEADSQAALEYHTSFDQAQTTTYQTLLINVGSGADESCAGELHIFNPASTTYVKHFYSKGARQDGSDFTGNIFVAGYVNTTAVIDDVQFRFSAGDFDGKIKMWGIP